MTLATKVLIVDDEDTIRESLSAWLSKEGYQVHVADSGYTALEMMDKTDYDLMLLDIKMPGLNGLETLERIKAAEHNPAVIMITAHGSIETAVEAMKNGASDYLLKPFDPEELSLLMERTAANIALKEENLALRDQLARQEEAVFGDLVAQSEPMLRLFDMIQDVAPSDAPVLITGETGTGKELIARAIHLHSRRAALPFVALNCGAQTESLLESELFGHERGAFTGAVRTRRGRLEMADQGTLFLDEVGEISPKMQVSLLRVLEEKTFHRVGGGDDLTTDFRLICATHRDLPRLIKDGQFREDFFYRINVITIPTPPLRERLEDVPLLAEYFLDRYTQETGKRFKGISAEGRALLAAYHWPGNVRELRNVVERAAVICRGRTIGAEEFTFLRAQAQPTPLAMSLKEVEINHIRTVLEMHDWNISRAALAMGIDRVTLSRKIKRHHLTRPE